jgi:hypothetical protein
VNIGIFHNNNDGAQNSGYSPGDTLTEVYRCEIDDPEIVGPGLEDRVYGLFSVTAEATTSPRHPNTLDYLARGNRPLRTGDVIEVGGVFYEQTPGGFVDHIERPEIGAAARPGTVPFSAPR